MHPHVRTDLPDFLTPKVAEPAKQLLACHLKDITESSSALDVIWTAVAAALLISEVPGVRSLGAASSTSQGKAGPRERGGWRPDPHLRGRSAPERRRAPGSIADVATASRDRASRSARPAPRACRPCRVLPRTRRTHRAGSAARPPRGRAPARGGSRSGPPGARAPSRPARAPSP